MAKLKAPSLQILLSKLAVSDQALLSMVWESQQRLNFWSIEQGKPKLRG